MKSASLFLTLFFFVAMFVLADHLFIGTELLNRPTHHSMSIHVIPAQDMEIYYEYGQQPGQYTGKSKIIHAKAYNPLNTTITDLLANTRYYYRMSYRPTGKSEFINRNEYSFHTQRKPGSTFVFTIQADSHLGTEKHCNPDLYRQMLLNAQVNLPDFHIDLGDTFRSSKLEDSKGKQGKQKNSKNKKNNKPEGVNFDSIQQLYLNQRPYFGILCHSAPLFLVLGNHEMEVGWEKNGTEECRPVWSTRARKMYYPNPVPDNFYTGNTKEEEFVGLRENYYAWEWGDALFVTLDPWWYTVGKEKENAEHGPKDLGAFTIGDDQYQWLKKTLEQSKARYKFVFSHHLIGSCRGAIEMAPYAEWGGMDRNGTPRFASMRPKWEMPIHQLMVKNKVTIFFQGHDHLFATQMLDGIVYQECPMPGYSEYYGQGGYQSGDILPSAGHIRAQVAPSGVTVEYVRAYLPEEEDGNEKQNGTVDYAYTIRSSGEMKVNFCSPEVIHATQNENKREGKRRGNSSGDDQ